jgi:hypothetical protein
MISKKLSILTLVLTLALAPQAIGAGNPTKSVQAVKITNGAGTINTNSSGTVTVPNATDTLMGKATTDTATNKTLAVGSNHITGTAARVPQFNSGTGDLESSSTTNTELGFLSGVTSSLCGINQTCTLTNKTLTAPIISTISNTGTLTLPTSTDTLVGRATTDALTNKDFDGGTASNTSRITLPKASTATLSGLTRKQATIAYDTDRNKAVIDNGSSLVPVGSGSGGSVNFIGQTTTWSADNTDDRDLESSVGNWVNFADAAASIPVDLTGGSPSTTCTRVTSSPNPLDGAGSLLITFPSGNHQGEGCSVVFNVQPAYQGGQATITFPLNIASGSIVQGDVKVFIYNVTKSLLITPDQNDVLSGPTVTATFPLTARDTVPVNHQYRLGIYRASASTAAVTLETDNFAVSPGQAAYGAAGSNALTFTPTLNGIVASSQTCTKQRDKDYLIVDCKITTGTNAASTASITLPDNLSIDYTKIRSGETKEVGIFHRRTNGGPSSVVDTNASPISAFTDGTDTTHVFFGKTTTNYELDKINASTLLNNSEKVDFRFTVPVAGYDAGINVSPSKTFWLSSYLANGSRVTGAAPTVLGQYRSYLRNAGAFTFTETNGSPTTTPTASDGVKIYTAATYAAADSNNQPSAYDFFVGQGKNIVIRAWTSTGQAGALDITPQVVSTTGFGLNANYVESTGILTVRLNGAQFATTNLKIGLDPIGSAGVTTAYFDVKVSDNAQMVGMQMPRSSVEVNTGNGHGSTNTKIRRFSTIKKNVGTAITYADSATAGGSFTLNEDGVYSVCFTDISPAGPANWGISQNSSQLTTSIASITDANIVMYTEGATNTKATACGTVLGANGDVIRAHTDGTPNGTNNSVRFIITKVSN